MEALIAKLAPYIAEYILAPLLAALGAWVLARLKAWLDEKVKGESAKNVLDRLGHHAQLVIADLWQREVQALKEAAADGKLSKEDAARFRQAAVDSIKGLLGPKGLGDLRQALDGGDVDAAIGASTEAAIAERRAMVRLSIEP